MWKSKRCRVIGILGALVAATAVSMGTVAADTASTLKITCTPPTGRVVVTAPFAATDIESYTFRLNATALGTATTCAYTYALPADTCVKTTDKITVVAVDKWGLVSVASTPWSPAADACNAKSAPLPPSNVQGVFGAL